MRPALLAILLASTLATALCERVSVDPRDPNAYQTLREAVAKLKAGDILWLAPGSGPYREELCIRTSGTKEAPIVIEGNGNEITGFDPLTFQDGTAQPSIEYPFVLRHHGQRVPEETAGRFGQSVTYDASNKRLTLAPGAPSDGWEISTRKFAVRIQDVSHHTYRDLIASGSQNDGFNLHGSGNHLLFEKITGRQNLDEGFSAHDTIHSEIRSGLFFENDNGMLSGQKTVTRMEAVDLWDNLGLGLGFNGEATVEARDTRVWGNGMNQLLLRAGVTASFVNVRIYTNPFATRLWLTYKESARLSKPVTTDVQPGVVWSASQPDMDPQTAPLKNEAPPIASLPTP